MASVPHPRTGVLAIPQVTPKTGQTAIIAQVDKSSDAYKMGQSAGKLLGLALLAAVLFALIQKIGKK